MIVRSVVDMAVMESVKVPKATPIAILSPTPLLYLHSATPALVTTINIPMTVITVGTHAPAKKSLPRRVLQTPVNIVAAHPQKDNPMLFVYQIHSTLMDYQPALADQSLMAYSRQLWAKHTLSILPL
jgi:hypothetical protein